MRFPFITDKQKTHTMASSHQSANVNMVIVGDSRTSSRRSLAHHNIDRYYKKVVVEMSEIVHSKRLTIIKQILNCVTRRYCSVHDRYRDVKENV